MFLAVVLLEVLGRDEALATLVTHVVGLHHVDLGLGVTVQVRLGDALVVAQTTVELSDPCNNVIKGQFLHTRVEITPKFLVVSRTT